MWSVASQLDEIVTRVCLEWVVSKAGMIVNE